MKCIVQVALSADASKICDWPYNVNCKVGATSTTTTRASTKLSTTPSSTTSTTKSTTTTPIQSSTYRSPIIPGYPCPPEDIAGGCKGPTDCLYPNPWNCNSFIQCNAGGIAYEMHCPSGLMWNDASKICDWPYNVNCKVDATSTTITSTTPSTTTPIESSTNGSPIIPGYVCPPEDIGGGCKGPKDCLYPNPNNCSSFIQCNDAGLAYDMPCAPGTQWNDNKKECDWPGESTCPKSTTTSTTISPTPTDDPCDNHSSTSTTEKSTEVC